MMSMMIVIRIEGYGDADFFSGLGRLYRFLWSVDGQVYNSL